MELYQEFEKDNAEGIIDIIDLGKNKKQIFLVVHRPPSKDVNTLLDNAKETHNVSFPIAAAITAYANIHMS